MDLLILVSPGTVPGAVQGNVLSVNIGFGFSRENSLNGKVLKTVSSTKVTNCVMG